MPAPRSELAGAVITRWRRMQDERRTFEDHWREIEDNVAPHTKERATALPGGKGRARQYDATPLMAAHALASATSAMLMPRSRQWISLRVHGGLDSAAAIAWKRDVERAMWTAFYDPHAGFQRAMGEVLFDAVTYGTGSVFVAMSHDLEHLVFRPAVVWDVFLGENGDGRIDTVYRVVRLTARQAARRWGIDNLGERTRKALEDGGNPDEEFIFLHAIQPRDERNPRLVTADNLPFASVWVDVASRHVVAESGFHEMPVVVARFDSIAGEVYGRSPAMTALPDIKTLHQMGRTLLRRSQMVTDPPMLLPNDGAVRRPQLLPGGIIPYDINTARILGGAPPVRDYVSRANIPIGREMQEDRRNQIREAFLRNALTLPVDGPRMTATEVLERRQEFLRAAGPVFGRLETEFLTPLVERTFGLLLRAGAFPDPPPEIEGAEVTFELESPVQKARKQIEVAAAAQQFEVLAPLMQARPEIWDNYDVDAIARDVSESMGVPPSWIMPEEQVAEIRRRRAEAIEAQQQAQLAEQASTVVQRVARAARPAA